ncbi:MAG: polyprenyl synthetase family protein [Oceanobacter sp.]
MRDTLNQVQLDMDQLLHESLEALSCPEPRLAEAMRYGLLNGGKRIRPLLAFAAAEAVGGQSRQANAAAVAIEMIHSYSLVHDDLPAMDDDDLRRGKPTTHIAFDEATAILAGDSLLTGAFEVLVGDENLSPAQQVALVSRMAKAAGAAGMVAGQSIDMCHVGKAMTLSELENMHRHKTGALIQAAVLAGAESVLYPLPDSVRSSLTRYADNIGLAFQIQDDILDVEGDTATLGKTQGADMALNKPTYPALLGLEGAKERAQTLIHEAISELAALAGNTATLAALASYIIDRDH